MVRIFYYRFNSFILLWIWRHKKTPILNINYPIFRVCVNSIHNCEKIGKMQKKKTVLSLFPLHFLLLKPDLQSFPMDSRTKKRQHINSIWPRFFLFGRVCHSAFVSLAAFKAKFIVINPAKGGIIQCAFDAYADRDTLLPDTVTNLLHLEIKSNSIILIIFNLMNKIYLSQKKEEEEVEYHSVFSPFASARNSVPSIFVLHCDYESVKRFPWNVKFLCLYPISFCLAAYKSLKSFGFAKGNKYPTI